MSKTWYPIIDYDKCIECLACYEFCAHGVYEIEGETKPKVVNPDNCITGCHGCESKCPAEALSYFNDSTNSCGDNCDCDCEGNCCK